MGGSKDDNFGSRCLICLDSEKNNEDMFHNSGKTPFVLECSPCVRRTSEDQMGLVESKQNV